MIGLYRSYAGTPRLKVRATFLTGTDEQLAEVAPWFNAGALPHAGALNQFLGKWLVKKKYCSVITYNDAEFSAQFYFVRKSTADGKRGFASLPPERVRELAAKGGRNGRGPRQANHVRRHASA